ncbi:DoxX-like family protein [Nioella nitratireducens]|uniref:DoxX-like family protein n=1 Tax=Nioella nitratireducens TaxID=1287720 RepID=UPI0008FD47D2|nr:DoxX-like family protein [Nioella nitratireducens]
MTAGRVLLLGADGFIGRYLAFGLRDAGVEVLASARRVTRLAQMGFDTLCADLEDPATHAPSFWSNALADCDFVVNAAGLLQGPDARFHAVHLAAPAAIYSAMPDGCRALLVSAVGIDHADTAFARYRREGEALAARHDATILRPGLVLGDTAYGGSALARGLAVLPLCIPVVGGDQRVNPIHAADLADVVAACLRDPPGPGPHEIGGPETLTQGDMLRELRRWFGLQSAPLWPLPQWLARLTARVGDALRLGPISTTALDQLAAGIEADAGPLVSRLPDEARPRGFSTFIAARPAGTGDLWHARLYLLRPLLRVALMLLWLVSGLIGLLLPAQAFLPLIPHAPLPEWSLIALARLGGMADLLIALALARAWRLRRVAGLQLALVGGYTLAFTLLAPGLWLLPLGGLLKNPALMLLVLIFLILEDER